MGKNAAILSEFDDCMCPSELQFDRLKRLLDSPALPNDMLKLDSRGLGNPEAVRELRSVVKQEGPVLVFVMETKIRGKHVERLQQTLGFAGCFAVDSAGLSGGLGLFWSKDVTVELKNYSSTHIDVVVRDALDASVSWRFTGFYGAPRAENRHHSWRFLRTLHNLPHADWLCMGDFNETLHGDEHFSQTARPEWQMRAFREATDECELQDLGWSGVPYTWDNRQSGDANVKARLDRVFANEEFRQKIEYVKSHNDYEQLVTETWRAQARQPGLHGVMNALEALQRKLMPWGVREFGCLTRTVRQLQKRLDRLRCQSVGRGPSQEETATMSKLREALKLEEIWLKQRSRVPWLREGDRNTAYFQAQARQRKRINKIANLQRSDGSFCASGDEDKEEIIEFYQALYTTQGYSNSEELLAYVPNRVTPAMNVMLCKPFEASEVQVALFQMSSSKAPGVDGFTAGFYQRHWELLKHDIVPAVLDFLNGGELPAGLNDTAITLIPKVERL
ncbi:uncharacterized protein [Aegilops tauschii subsp. strangulata]|uniref:uncharacterized protein n=1 Tax=Aegilops tauschii subsp. strangulata TaxID=200361 RepID=UPI003CC876C3